MKEEDRQKFLMVKINKLAQFEEEWECSADKQKMIIRDISGKLIRPTLLIVANKEGFILRTDIITRKPDESALADFLFETMKRPMKSGYSARRPQKIVTDLTLDIEELSQRLSAADVQCEYKAELTVIPAIKHELARFAAANADNSYLSQPGLATLPGASVELVRHIFEMTDKLYQAQIWRWIDQSQIMDISFPAGSEARILSIMGKSKITFGFAFFNNIADIMDINRGRVATDENGHSSMRSLSVVYGTHNEIRVDDNEFIEENQLTIADQNAYPAISLSSQEEMYLPSAAELIWLEGALATLIAWLDSIRDADNNLDADKMFARHKLKIDTVFGQQRATIKFSEEIDSYY